MIAVKLPFKLKIPVLACGADLKGAFALVKKSKGYLIDGFGDLSGLDNFVRYEKAIKKYQRDLKINPKAIACDMHHGYFSTRFAEEWSKGHGTEVNKIQHHEAHVASAIVDNDIKGTVIGAAFDGTGLGTDGSIWGGEFFVGSLKGFKRAAHLEYVRMPGLDMAIKEPWRMAAAYLYYAFGEDFLDLKIELVKKADKDKWLILKAMIDKKLNSPFTSSMGRLFDAAASLILSKENAAFEAELPMALEKIVASRCQDSYSFDMKTKGGILIIDTVKLIKGIVKDLSKNVNAGIMAAKFHNTVAEMTLKVAMRLRKKFNTKRIVLTGGVFQNKYLLNRSTELLRKKHFDVYTHSKVPTNDSGIPIGQLAIAGAR